MTLADEDDPQAHATRSAPLVERVISVEDYVIEVNGALELP